MDKLNKNEWKEFQERVKEQDRLQSDHMGVNLLVMNIELEIRGNLSHTTMCDEIELDSWKVMPISMRVKDFCNHCEFKCEHGKRLIQLNNKRRSGQ